MWKSGIQFHLGRLKYRTYFFTSRTHSYLATTFSSIIPTQSWKHTKHMLLTRVPRLRFRRPPSERILEGLASPSPRHVGPWLQVFQPNPQTSRERPPLVPLGDWLRCVRSTLGCAGLSCLLPSFDSAQPTQAQPHVYAARYRCITRRGSVIQFGCP